MKKIVVIGSSNIDYIGYSDKQLIDYDSNIGLIKKSFGGVGRNIVENLVRLKQDVTFITAIGNDSTSQELENELLNLNCKIIKPVSNLPSASYLAIMDENKDMRIGLCDARIVETINESFLREYDDVLKNCDYLVVDGNLTIETIDYLFNRYSYKKIIVDGVSTAKIIKFKDFINRIYLLKVNKIEYETLCKQTNDYPCNLVITEGAKSIIYRNNFNEINIPVIKKAKVVNSTGAGDAMLAGIIYGIVNDYSFIDSINLGKTLASLSLDSEDSVNKDLNEELLKNVL